MWLRPRDMPPAKAPGQRRELARRQRCEPWCSVEGSGARRSLWRGALRPWRHHGRARRWRSRSCPRCCRIGRRRERWRALDQRGIAGWSRGGNAVPCRQLFFPILSAPNNLVLSYLLLSLSLSLSLTLFFVLLLCWGLVVGFVFCCFVGVLLVCLFVCLLVNPGFFLPLRRNRFETWGAAPDPAPAGGSFFFFSFLSSSLSLFSLERSFRL